MNKKTVFYIALGLIFLGVFNTIFFLLGGVKHPVSVWISYGCIHFSYLILLFTGFFSKGSSKYIMSLPLYTFSTLFFLVELVVSLIFILISSDSYTATIIVQVLLFGVYGLVLLTNLISNESTAEAIELRELEYSFIKDSSSRVNFLMNKLPDKEINKKIERVYDELHSSPTKSSPSVKSIESDIIMNIDSLESAVSSGSQDKVLKITNELLDLIKERNRIIQYKV